MPEASKETTPKGQAEELIPIFIMGQKFDVPPTPPKTLLDAYKIAREVLPYVYIGNLPIAGTENTYCPECGNLLVERQGFPATMPGITPDGKCSKCGRPVDIIL